LPVKGMSLTLRPSRPTLFPYTTLFRSYGPQGDCGCCEDEGGGCTILADNFNRDDSTDIGPEWDEVEGDWSINSNRLVVSGSGIRSEEHTSELQSRENLV